MARERKQTGGEKVIAFRVSEQTFPALERLKRRHAKNWPELTLRAIIKAYSGESEEDAEDCRQVEMELAGEVASSSAEPSEPVVETMEAVAPSGEVSEEIEPNSEQVASGNTSSVEFTNEETMKLKAPVVTCKGCQQRITKGTLVIKRADGYYHPSCLTTSLDR
jgi:hypothetical protein